MSAEKPTDAEIIGGLEYQATKHDEPALWLAAARLKELVASRNDLRGALPEIIDFLEVQVVVFKTERRNGNAAFTEKVVALFKAFMSNTIEPK